MVDARGEEEESHVRSRWAESVELGTAQLDRMCWITCPRLLLKENACADVISTRHAFANPRPRARMHPYQPSLG